MRLQASAGRKVRNWICSALAVLQHPFSSFSLQNLRKIQLLTCLAGQGRLCWHQELRSLPGSLTHIHMNSILLCMSFGSVMKRIPFTKGRSEWTYLHEKTGSLVWPGNEGIQRGQHNTIIREVVRDPDVFTSNVPGHAMETFILSTLDLCCVVASRRACSWSIHGRKKRCELGIR